jgi:hypothetical protein
MWLGSFSFSANGQTSPASRVIQNANDINDPSAIRTALRQESRKEEGSSRQRTPVKVLAKASGL